MGARIHPNPCTPLATRLWAKIAKAGPGDCWPWQGSPDANGYGRIGAGGKYGKSLLAHRAAYESAVGPIPPGLHVLHRCDNPPCCNPAHLWAGTDADNNADMIAKGRKRWRASQGTAHGCAKLTDAQVLAIRSAPGKQRDIAKEYGVSQTTVNYIKLRKLWTHLPENGEKS